MWQQLLSLKKMIKTKPFSDSDKERLLSIVRDSLVNRKMPGKIKGPKDLEDWISENLLYAICDLENQVIGFVQLYPLSKTLIKRLDLKDPKNLYEISFALPEEYRYTSGLVSGAVREICALYPDFRIVAFSDPNNEKSIRVLERCGFTLIGKTKYHANEKIENLVYSNKV